MIVESPSRLVEDTYIFLKVRMAALDYHVKNIPCEYVPDQIGFRFRFRLSLSTHYTSLFSPNQQL